MGNKPKPRRPRRTRPLVETGDITPGADISDDDAVAIVLTELGAHLEPRAIRDADPAQRAAAVELQHIARSLAHGNQVLRLAVGEARRRGLSWDTIGWCVGLTGQAVRKRFGA